MSSLSCKNPRLHRRTNAEMRSEPRTRRCKMLYVRPPPPPCSAIYPAPSHTYQLLLLAQSANWSEPPLHRARWPPTPTLLTQWQAARLGTSHVYAYMHACVCGRATQDRGTQTRILGISYRPSHNPSALRNSAEL